MSSDDRDAGFSPGRIVAVHGDVIDIEFRERLPNINDAIEVRRTDGPPGADDSWTKSSASTRNSPPGQGNPSAPDNLCVKIG